MAPARTGTNWAGASLSCCPSTPHAAHTALRRITFHCIQIRPPQSSSRQRARAIWRPCLLGHSWKACSSSQQECLSPWEQGSQRSSSVRVAEEQRRLLQPVHAHYQAHPSLSRASLSPAVGEGRIKSSPHWAQASHFTLFTGLLFWGGV